MDEMKWAWVLFVAATLALLVRLAMWFLPSPALRHSQKVSSAADSIPVSAPAERPAEAPLPRPMTETEGPAAAPQEEDWPVAEPVRAPIPRMEAKTVPSGPPPEEFHLRHTRWGMSREEVRASEAEVPLRESESSLLYSTTTLEMPCLLTYSFAEGRLARARLSFSDPAGRDIPPLTVAQAQRRYLYLREQLRARYGEPVQKTVHMPRDVSGLRRSVQKQDELSAQYDLEIAEAEERMKRQREILQRRFARWASPAEMVEREIYPYERDLAELRVWKKEAVDRANETRKHIAKSQEADFSSPLVATMTSRWPFARGVHDIELKLDCRPAVPRLDIRYQSTQALPGDWEKNAL